MSNEIVTSDLSEFGKIELDEVVILLSEYSKNRSILGDKVKPFFNKQSGKVFLSDEDYNTTMINLDKKLELWINCSNCGEEGFLSEGFNEESHLCNECHKNENSEE